MLFRDLTPPGVARARLGWYVLRVLVPGLQPLHGHDALSHLGGPLWSPRGLADWAAEPPLTVALADIDGFAVLNERHGHDAGDQVIALVQQAMKGSLPSGSYLVKQHVEPLPKQVNDEIVRTKVWNLIETLASGASSATKAA